MSAEDYGFSSEDDARHLRDELRAAHAQIATLRAENAQLRGALRGHVVVQYVNATTKVCLRCKCAWTTEQPEHHAPGCLAAPEKEPNP